MCGQFALLVLIEVAGEAGISVSDIGAFGNPVSRLIIDRTRGALCN